MLGIPFDQDLLRRSIDCSVAMLGIPFDQVSRIPHDFESFLANKKLNPERRGYRLKGEKTIVCTRRRWRGWDEMAQKAEN